MELGHLLYLGALCVLCRPITDHHKVSISMHYECTCNYQRPGAHVCVCVFIMYKCCVVECLVCLKECTSSSCDHYIVILHMMVSAIAMIKFQVEHCYTHRDGEQHNTQQLSPSQTRPIQYSKDCYWLGVTLKGSTSIHMPTTHQPVPHFKQSIARSHPPWQRLGTGSLWCSRHEPPAPHSQW